MDQSSLTFLDFAGLFLGHLMLGIGITLFCDWDWIPISDSDRSRGLSLDLLKKQIFSE